MREKIITDASLNYDESSESKQLLFKKISNRKWGLRVLGGIGAMQILIPIHIILTTRLGNNFQWMFPYNIALWYIYYNNNIIIIIIIISIIIILYRGARAISNPGVYDDYDDYYSGNTIDPNPHQALWGSSAPSWTRYIIIIINH